MGKLVSIVTTCLVVSSSRITFDKKLTVSTDHTTDRHGHDGPSRLFAPKHLNSKNLGTGINSLNFAMELQHGPS